MKKAKKLVVNTIIMTAATLTINGVSMWLNVYIAGKIGAEGMGIFQLIMSVFMFSVTLAISGIGLATTRLVAEEQARGCERGASAAVKKCLLYATTLGIFAAVLLYFTAPFIGTNWLGTALTVKPLRILAAALPFISLSTVMSGYFTAVRRVGKASFAAIIEEVVRCYLTILLLQMFLPRGLEWACMGVVIGGTCSEVFACVTRAILFTYDRHKHKSLGGLPVPTDISKRMFGIAVPVASSQYLRSALGTLKQIITPIFLEKSALNKDQAIAQYGLVRGMALSVILFPACLLYAFSGLVMPEVARFFAVKNERKIGETISRSIKYTALFSMLVCGVMFRFGDELGTKLYNNSQVGTFIVILSLAVPIMYFDTVIDGLLNGLNQQVAVVRINIIDTLSTILMTIILLPRYGVMGYVISIYLSELLNTVLSTHRLIKVSKAKFNFNEWFLKPALAVAIAVLATRFIHMHIVGEIVVYTVVYLALLVLLRSLTKKDFKLLK